MGSFLRIYERLLHKYPLLTSSVQTGCITAFGDIIAQTVVERKRLKDVNLVRTSQFACIGLICVGPPVTFWYRTLSKIFGDVGKTTTLKKLACDQCLFAPTFIVIYIVSLSVIQGNDLNFAWNEIKKNYFDILMTNYKLWPLAQIGNFYFVPMRYQILVAQIVALFWNTYLSWKTQTGVLISEQKLPKD